MSPQEQNRMKKAITASKETWTQQRKRLEAALDDSVKVLQEGDPFEMAMHLETVHSFYQQERNAYNKFRETMSTAQSA